MEDNKVIHYTLSEDEYQEMIKFHHNNVNLKQRALVAFLVSV
ncbi:hypothetical protein AB837_00056 [bacterium AB1]|nr:hypothetical protein AB837_00056 [bacterium AB1]